MRDNKFYFFVFGLLGLYLINILEVVQNEVIVQNVFKRVLGGETILLLFGIATLIFSAMIAIAVLVVVDITKQWWQEGDDA